MLTDTIYIFSDKKKLNQKKIIQLNRFGEAVTSHHPCMQSIGSSLSPRHVTTTESKTVELQERHIYNTPRIIHYENNISKRKPELAITQCNLVR